MRFILRPSLLKSTTAPKKPTGYDWAWGVANHHAQHAMAHYNAAKEAHAAGNTEVRDQHLAAHKKHAEQSNWHAEFNANKGKLKTMTPRGSKMSHLMDSRKDHKIAGLKPTDYHPHEHDHPKSPFGKT